jgi:hypothetical protein
MSNKQLIMTKKRHNSVDLKTKYDYDDSAGFYSNYKPKVKQLNNNNNTNTPAKSLVVKIDDESFNKYSIEVADSSENSSSKSLLSADRLKTIRTMIKNSKKSNYYTESLYAKNAAMTASFRHQNINNNHQEKIGLPIALPESDDSLVDPSNRSISSGHYSPYMTKKNIKKFERDQESIGTCFLIQQYIIYFLILVFIFGVSFGFYYLFVSFQLKINQLEAKLSEKIHTRLALKFLSKNDETNDYDFKLSNFDQKFMNNQYFMLSNNIGSDESPSKSSKSILKEKYFIMKQIDNYKFLILPIISNSKNTVSNIR